MGGLNKQNMKPEQQRENNIYKHKKQLITHTPWYVPSYEYAALIMSLHGFSAVALGVQNHVGQIKRKTRF